MGCSLTAAAGRGAHTMPKYKHIDLRRTVAPPKDRRTARKARQAMQDMQAARAAQGARKDD
jgi:hypothetical protein